MASQPMLRAITGPLSGSVFPVIDQLVIGRSDEADIPVPDESVSREHAVVTVGSRGEVTILDLSMNGTFVAGKAVKQGTLVPGCTVRIGKSQFVFERSDEAGVVRRSASSSSSESSESGDRDRPTRVDIMAVARREVVSHGLGFKTTQAVTLDDIPDEFE